MNGTCSMDAVGLPLNPVTLHPNTTLTNDAFLCSCTSTSTSLSNSQAHPNITISIMPTKTTLFQETVLPSEELHAHHCASSIFPSQSMAVSSPLFISSSYKSDYQNSTCVFIVVTRPSKQEATPVCSLPCYQGWAFNTFSQ